MVFLDARIQVGSCLTMAGLVGKFGDGIFKGKRIWEMEKEDEEGETMDSIWIDESRMPRAITAITFQ